MGESCTERCISAAAILFTAEIAGVTEETEKWNQAFARFVGSGIGMPSLVAEAGAARASVAAGRLG